MSLRTLSPVLFTLFISVNVLAQSSSSIDSIKNTIETVSNEFQVCVQPYALCTSAPCIPMPTDGNPDLMICQCDVVNSGHMVSLSALDNIVTDCESVAPFSLNGVDYIYSTYSTKQEPEEHRRFMTCDSIYTWSNCLNMLCIINPDKVTATCFCQKVINKESVTLGGRCIQETCEDHYWSAATAYAANQATAYLNAWLKKNNYPDSLIIESRYCRD